MNASWRVIAVTALAVSLAGCGGGVGGRLNPSQIVPQGPLDRQAASTNWQVAVGAEDGGGAFQGLDYYNRTITIDAGDRVTWTIADGPSPTNSEPHTISFLAPGQHAPPPKSKKAEDPYGGKTEDGRKFTSSGLLVYGQKYSLTFPKRGTYVYYCLIHYPEMAGTVVVQAAGAPYPKTQQQYDREGAQDRRVDLALAREGISEFPYIPGGRELAAGISPGLSHAPSNSTALRFLDTYNLTRHVMVRLGASVAWTNNSSNEFHTVTFPPAGQKDPQINPFSPPSGGHKYDGKHLVNSGVIRPGKSFTLKFTARGSFNYWCEFHDNVGMMGTVDVR